MEIYREQDVLVPSFLSKEPLTQSLASTLAEVIEIYRRQGVLIPSFLSRNP
jgi:hypothetical protein